MKTKHLTHSRAKWLLSLGALLATGLTSAWGLTPAGTEIRNQSTATYLDPSGVSQVATSNEVINTVLPLYGVVVTPNATGASGFFDYDGTAALTQVTAPGNVAYYAYILENTGNAPDTFQVNALNFNGAALAPATTGVEIYYDANGNGFVDAGDILLSRRTAAGVLTTPGTTPIVNPGQKLPLVVAVHTPSSAVVANTIDTDFNVLGVTGSATDAVSNWNQTTFAPGVGIVTAYKSADVTSVVPGYQNVLYTLQGSNTGSAPVSSVVFNSGEIDIDGSGDINATDNVEGILIVDILDNTKIDVGADYANINPITTPGQISPSTAIPLYWDAANTRWSSVKPTQAASTTAGTDFRIALFIPDADSVVAPGNETSDPVLSPGQSYRMSFTVDILPGIAATTLENQVSGQYITGVTTRDFESNLHIIDIGGDPSTVTVDVELSPYTFLDGVTAFGAEITTGTTRGADNAATSEHPQVDTLGLFATDDVTYAGSSASALTHRNAGTTVVFPLTVHNPIATSSATDVFNISIVSGVPAGWTATLFKADGITPLADTNGDSRPDVGELAPGGTTDLVVKVNIPANAPQSFGAVSIVVRATSVKNSSVTNNTTLEISEVRPAGVDIAVSGEIAGGDITQTAADATANDDTIIANVQPGSNVPVAIQVANMRNPLQSPSNNDELTSAVDTYNLTFIKNGGASAFDVVLFRDVNGDGVLDAAELNPISDTGPLNPLTGVNPNVGPLFNMIARVTVPSTTAPGNYDIDVVATSTNNPAQSDSMRVRVQVVAAPAISVTPDNTATVIRGGSVTFKHVVTNLGNTSGTVTLSSAFPAGLLPTGYTAVFVDVDGSILGDGVTFTTANLGPAGTEEFYVRVFVPANASVGAVIPVTISGAGNGDLAPAADSAVDIITVIDGSLDLQKTNDPAGGLIPGSTITYHTDFKNLGGGSITDVVVFDAIPANATFVAASIATSSLPAGVTFEAQYSTNNGILWTNVAPAAANVTNVRVVLLRVTPVNGLLPGESGRFTFQVTID